MSKKKAEPARDPKAVDNAHVEMLRQLGASRGNGTLGSVTNIEQVMEGELIRRGLEYGAQVELGFTRLDHIIYNGDGTATGVYVDGSHWHEDEKGHDYGKVQQLVGFEVGGSTITNAVRVGEADLLANPEWVVDTVQRGEWINEGG